MLGIWRFAQLPKSASQRISCKKVFPHGSENFIHQSPQRKLLVIGKKEPTQKPFFFSKSVYGRYFWIPLLKTPSFFGIRDSLQNQSQQFGLNFNGSFLFLVFLTSPGRGLAPLHCGPLPKRDCDFAPWGEWGECSASCDGGMRERSRHIKTPNSNDGARGEWEGVKLVKKLF